MRTLCLLTLGCLVGLFVYAYELKVEIRALQAHEAALSSTIQDENDFITLMRAEVSHLSRPSRIDQLARDVLKFEPVNPAQTVPLSAVLPLASREWTPQISTAPRTPRKEGIAALIDRTAGAPARPAQR